MRPCRLGPLGSRWLCAASFHGGRNGREAGPTPLILRRSTPRHSSLLLHVDGSVGREEPPPLAPHLLRDWKGGPSALD